MSGRHVNRRVHILEVSTTTVLVLLLASCACAFVYYWKLNCTLAKALELDDLQATHNLVKYGADTLIRTRSGRTVLALAVVHRDRELAELALDRGAVADTKVVGTRPFLYPSSNIPVLVASIMNNDTQMALLLLKKGANPDGELAAPGMPLYWAVLHGNSEIVSELLRQRARIDGYATAALPVAVYKGYTRIVRLLLKAGVSPRGPRWDGKTPLTIAREEGHREISELLVRYGATR